MKTTIKKQAKLTGERAKQAREILRLNEEQRVSDARADEEEDKEIDERDLQEEIMELFDQLPISEMDEISNSDPIEGVREALECFGEDELIELRDELQEKVRKLNQKHLFIIYDKLNEQYEFVAKTKEEAVLKFLKNQGYFIKKRITNLNK